MQIQTKSTFKIKLTLLALPLFLCVPHGTATAQDRQGAYAQAVFQLASAQRRFNFNRRNIRADNYYYRKKKKRLRSTSRRKSYRQRLKDIATWHVDEDNKDPIQLIVERAQQRISVYKGAQLVTTSRVSSGKKGYATPTGVFSILGKRVFHRSNIYSAAPMPYMQRLTWSGIALHASNSVPNRPASHGCVRLPNSFAPKLFKFTERGAHVIIADEKPHIVNFEDLTFLKPLSPEDREKELEKIKAELRAQKIADMKQQAEKEALKKALKEKKKQKASAQKAQAPEAGAQAAERRESELALEPEVPEVEVTLSDSPLRILITRRMGRERVRDVQDMLRELGYEPGESDGYMGKDTGKAILAFQEAEGVQKTGAFSDELVGQLYQKARGTQEPTGYLYVRQDFKNLLSSPVVLKDPHVPLGTHLITAQHFMPGDAAVRWRGMTLKDEVPEFLAEDSDKAEKSSHITKPFTPIKLALSGGSVPVGGKPETAAAEPEPQGARAGQKIDREKAEALRKEEEAAKEAALADKQARDKITAVLARVSMPQDVATRLSLLLTPGSSIAISDKGLSKETTPWGTDFILLTR